MNGLRNFFSRIMGWSSVRGSYSDGTSDNPVHQGTKSSSETSAKNAQGQEVSKNVPLQKRKVTWTASPFNLMRALEKPIDYLWGKAWKRPSSYESWPKKAYDQLTKNIPMEVIVKYNHRPYQLLEACIEKNVNQNLQQAINALIEAIIWRFDVASYSHLSKKGATEVLRKAVKSGYAKLIKLFLDRCTQDVRTAVCNKYASEIYRSMQTEDIDCAKSLMEAGVNLNYRNEFGETLLHTCLEKALDGISEPSQEMALNRAKALIKAGVDLNILSRNSSLTRGAPPLNVALYYWDQNKNKNTSESAQSVRNSHEIIEALLEAGIDLELTDQEGNTALHKAASTGNTEILNTLIKKGANIHATNNNGDTPLHLAIRKGNMEAARLLMRQTDLKPSTEPNNLDQQILFLAIEEGRIDFIEELLTHNTIDRNGKNENGETPLHIAIANGNIEVLKLLLNIEDEAEELTLPTYILVNEKSNYGETLLMCAVDLGSVRLVEMLLKHPNIDIDIRANKEEGGNNTAFMMALKEGNAEMIKVFVEESQKYDHIDLNINAELEDGKTALMLAAERGHGDCIRELLKHPDIDINKKDASGKTALMLAMKEGNVYNALDAFVEHKDIEGMLNETDNEGNTAFMIALEKGYSDSIRFFANRAGGINESIANG